MTTPNRNRPQRVQLSGLIDDGYKELKKLEQDRADGNMQTPHLFLKIGAGGEYTDGVVTVTGKEKHFIIHRKMGGAIYSDASSFNLQNAEKSVLEFCPMLLIVENHHKVLKIANSMFGRDIDKLIISEMKYINAPTSVTEPVETRNSEFDLVRIIFTDFHSSKYFFMIAFNSGKITETFISYDHEGTSAPGNHVFTYESYSGKLTIQ